MDRENTIASILRIIGVIVIIIGFLSLLFWSSGDHTEGLGNLSSQLGWSSFFSSIVSGVILIGFAEVISLLQGIYNRQAKPVEQPSQEGNLEVQPTQKTGEFMPTGDVLEGIYAFYEKKNEQVKEIRPTHYEGIAIVDLERRVDVIDVNGFTPKVLTKEERSRLNIEEE